MGKHILSDNPSTKKPLPERFMLAGFLVDSRRGEIVAGQDKTQPPHQIEPKVMAVLLLLAQHHGDVVSQEDIFTQVWPGSVFSPGSIQRCITLLRKAFDDDAKRQDVIVTHPKRGYSLKPAVESLDLPTNKKELEKEQEKPDQQPKVLALSIAGLAILLFLFFFRTFNPFSPSDPATVITPFEISQMQPITATGRNEYFSRYSADNRYVAFIRQDDNGLDSVWLKIVASDELILLTKQPADVVSLRWSKTTNTLLYVLQQGDDISVQKIQLSSTGEPALPVEILKHPNLSRFRGIDWQPGKALYYLADEQGQTRLFETRLSDGQRRILLTGQSGFKPYGMALSSHISVPNGAASDGQEMVIIGFNQALQTVVKLLKLPSFDSSNSLDSRGKKPQTTDLALLDPNVYAIDWHPHQRTFLLSDGNQLMQMDKNGQLSKINFENFSYIRYPHYSHQGKGITLTLEKTDSDLWLTSLTTPQLTQKVIDSNTLDYAPTLSPDGTQFAFISQRKGYPQLYVHDIKSKKNRLIYQNPRQELYLAPPVWHPTDNRIASAINDKPLLITLTAEQTQLNEFDQAFGHPLQWYPAENALLVVNYSDKVQYFAKWTIETQELTPFTESSDLQAHLNPQGELLTVSNQEIRRHTVTDDIADDKAAVLFTVEGQIITSLAKDDGLYLHISKDDIQTLWVFAFADHSFHKVQSLPDDTYTLGDLHRRHNLLLLETQVVKKEILLLRGDR